INLCFIVAPIAYVALRQYSVIVSTPPGRYAVHWGVSLTQDHERYVVTLMQNIQYFQLIMMVFVALLIAGSWYSANLVYHHDDLWPSCFIPAVIWMIVSCIVIRSVFEGDEEIKDKKKEEIKDKKKEEIKDKKKQDDETLGEFIGITFIGVIGFMGLLILLGGLLILLGDLIQPYRVIFERSADGLYYEMNIAQLLMVHNVIILQLLAPTAIWLGIKK
ncbi:MAG: hypothetical protein BWK78_05905, partial [Thiotrichaceae bacterium IS1]